jgi:hypothetical protein
MSTFLEKLASVATDEDKTTVGTNHVHTQPPSGSSCEDPTWGEKPKHEPFHHSDGVYREYRKENHEMLDRILSNFGSQAATDKKLIDQLFGHGGAGEYTGRSPALNRTTVKSAETLSEKARKLRER